MDLSYINYKKTTYQKADRDVYIKNFKKDKSFANYMNVKRALFFFYKYGLDIRGLFGLNVTNVNNLNIIAEDFYNFSSSFTSTKLSFKKYFLYKINDRLLFKKMYNKDKVIVFDKPFWRKNVKTLDGLLYFFHRYDYKMLYLTTSRFFYEANSLNYFNKSKFFRNIINRAGNPAFFNFFLKKVNRVSKGVVVLMLDDSFYTKLTNLSILIFNFINSNSKSHGFFYIVFIDLSTYYNTFMALNYFYISKNIGNRSKFINYLTIYSNYKKLK